MFYRAQNELVTQTGRSNGLSQSRYIHKEHKKNQWGKLNYFLTKEKLKNDLHTNFKNEHVHTVNEVFNYCPMILNYLRMKGYNKILFVGHFNSAQRYWYFLRKSDRNLFMSPSYRSGSEYMIDPNIWLQFLPIVAKAYQYLDGEGFQIHTVVPPESRHRQIMHAVYKRYEIDLIPANKQYKHGMTSYEITKPQDVRYDAVVFAGVPKENPEVSFHHHYIRSLFQPYCVEGFDIVDLNYQNPDRFKYIDGIREDNGSYLEQVFTTRCIWDEQFAKRTDEDRRIEYQTLDTIIKCYKA